MYGEVGVINMNNQMNNGQINRGASNMRMNAQQQSTKMKKMPNAAKNNPKYTENWLNLKTINNGIMYNNQGEMVTGVKIQPKNIFILDSSEMDRVLIGLMNFYNNINYEFWLVVADRPVDIAMYQAELQLLYQQTTDQRIRKLIAQDMDKGDFFKNNNVVDTEYFILFKEKNMELLQKKVRGMITELMAAGLNASQTTNDDLRMIIDNFLNGGKDFRSGGVMPR